MNEEVKYIIVLLYIIIGMVVYGHYYKEAAERDKTVEELRKTTDAWLAVIMFWVIIAAGEIMTWFNKEDKKKQ
jgi:TRAP-type C4-dicarboxylate transport system permease large subunit